MFYSLAQQKRKPVKSWERPGLSGRPCKRNLTHVSLSPVTQRSTQCHAALNTVFQMSAFLAVTKGSCPSTSDPPNPCSSHCVGGKVPEKLCKHASTSGPWLDSPPDTTTSCCLTSSSALSSSMLREAFPSYLKTAPCPCLGMCHLLLDVISSQSLSHFMWYVSYFFSPFHVNTLASHKVITDTLYHLQDSSAYSECQHKRGEGHLGGPHLGSGVSLYETAHVTVRRPGPQGCSEWSLMPEHVTFSSEWRESTPERDLEQKAR